MARATKRARVEASVSIDEERQRAFVLSAVVLVAVVFLFLILRDPVWRFLHGGDLAEPVGRQATGWTQLDERLVRRLEGVELRPASGNEALEAAIVEEIVAVRSRLDEAEQQAADAATPPVMVSGSAGAPPGGGTLSSSSGGPASVGGGSLGSAQASPAPLPPPIEASESLRAIARHFARTRLAVDAGEPKPPELLHTALYLSLAQPEFLVKSVVVQQPLSPVLPADTAAFASELVGGWMNTLHFSSMVEQGESVLVAAGVVQDAGVARVEVILLERFVELAGRLPGATEEEATVWLTGRRSEPVETTLFFKGPSDPSFFPVEAEWNGESFSLELGWDQGAGIYALRAGRQDRLSDARPILVE